MSNQTGTLCLSGRRAVVVGGAVGWGAAASRRLAEEGADVIVVDWRCEAAEALVDGSAGRISFVQAAIDDSGAMIDAAATVNKYSIDILVTHYMDLDWASVEECRVEDFARVVQHNLVGPVLATKAFLPALKRSNAGSIIHITSIDGVHGSPRVPSYSASKGGIIPLTHVMAFEFAPQNIRVNAIATGQTLQVSEEEKARSIAIFKGFPGGDYVDQLNAATPLKRSGSLRDWAGTVVFLASDYSSHMTGSVMVVDCGRLTITPGTA